MSMRNYVTVTVGGARASHYCLVCTAGESAKQAISLSMSRLLKGLLYNNSWWTGVDEATSTSLKGIQRAQPAPPVNLLNNNNRSETSLELLKHGTVLID